MRHSISGQTPSKSLPLLATLVDRIPLVTAQLELPTFWRVVRELRPSSPVQCRALAALISISYRKGNLGRAMHMVVEIFPCRMGKPYSYHLLIRAMAKTQLGHGDVP